MPLVNLRLYRNSTYATATVVGVFLGFFALFGSNRLLPCFLQAFRDSTALQTALIMLPGVALTGISSPLVGKGSDRFNPRIFLVLGFLLAAASTYWFAWMGLQTEARTFVWALIVRAGLGLVFPPRGWLLQHGGDVGDLLNTKVQAVLSRYLTLEALGIAFQDCFLVFAFVYVIAALASLCIPGGHRNAS